MVAHNGAVQVHGHDWVGALAPCVAVAAAAVVAKQVDFEAKKTADVATRNDKDSKECLDLRTHVVTTHETRLKSFDPNVQMVYIPEQEIYLGLY